MKYTTYNLTIDSEFPLPELLPLASDNARNAPADVAIRFGKVDHNGLSGGQQLGPFLWVNRESLWLDVPNVARFLVQNGATILIDPMPGIDEDSIRVFLLGSALGALLFQRGFLVLHGNAIRIGEQCMICVGHSGAGKSTLAAGFMQRGYQILADDVVPVDQECRAMPGSPRIKLWQDAADKLRIDTSGLRRIRPNTEKFNYPLADRFADQPVPIRWIYILDNDNSGTIHSQPIRGMQRFMPIHDNTYRVHYLQGMSLESQHLHLCGQLVGRIHLARVTRPQSGFGLNALIDHLLADMAAHP